MIAPVLAEPPQVRATETAGQRSSGQAGQRLAQRSVIIATEDSTGAQACMHQAAAQGGRPPGLGLRARAGARARCQTTGPGAPSAAQPDAGEAPGLAPRKHGPRSGSGPWTGQRKLEERGDVQSKKRMAPGGVPLAGLTARCRVRLQSPLGCSRAHAGRPKVREDGLTHCQKS